MQLPKTLPDESLFSRICRHLTVFELPIQQSLKWLVGDGRAVIHPYLTANLHHIAQFTDESSDQILAHQTIRPLFSYFLPQHRAVIEDVFAGANEVVRASQLSTFRDKECLSVKHCPLCAKDDVYDFGVAYWHLIHQVPGVEACSKHKTWLLHNDLPGRSHVNNHLLPDFKLQTNCCSKSAQEFSEFVTNKMKTLLADKLSLEALSAGYFRRLNINGRLTQRGRVKRKKITTELFELSEELFPMNSALSLRSAKDFRYVSSLLSGQYPQHPFKHLLFEFYLSRYQFDDTQKARVLYIQDIHQNKEEQCCELLRAGLSMAAVSREVSKSRCYVKSIALKNNIPVNLKPKTITKDLKDSVVKLARKGFRREAIAKIHSVSTGSVELIISTTTGLVEWRKRCKSESLRRRYRCQIVRFVALNPNAYRQEIKSANEAGFYWLYIHERDWLEGVLPVATQTEHVDRIDWCQRDNKLVGMVRELLLSSSAMVSRTELDKLLGGHGWLTSKIAKLPKTRALLREKGLFPSNP
ncbi:TnsD family Tn7-like transposition protein [Vibrio vulnificus]|uniref:TnsD family Tn7-like transposition protein n=1 Tax=Vibrio vulnificus TaxID=672 RepID=UPI001A236089|nr:transposase [Vibrio vulnificus]HAS6036781.1 transposase [Vibrio vulnificus]HAS6410229.1 transposase [Vibrio vulnificus]HAS6415203.1 transposase [Vibrio vulnificus]HDY7429405.1 TniQ family protein [Vibrio vulnificus]